MRAQFPDLTDLQYKFAESYAKSGNGMKSVREAGFNYSTPGSQSSAAHRLLQKRKITDAIERIREAQS